MATPKLLLVKKEVTYGVEAVGAPADAVRAEEVVFTPRGDRSNPDVAKPGVGPVAGQMVGVYGELTFKVPMITAGVKGTAPKWGYLIKMCGGSETIVATTSVSYGLAADPSGADSGSINWREGRRQHKLLGARGTVEVDNSEKQRPMLIFKMKGLKVPVADGAALTQGDATWTGWTDQLPIAQGRTVFTIAGVTPPLYALSISSSDNAQFIDVPNQKAVDLLGARTYTGKLKVGTLLPSVFNPEVLAESDAVVVWSMVHGATAGNILTINGRCQISMPTYSDNNGRDQTEFDLGFVPSALNTDDDWSIVIT